MANFYKVGGCVRDKIMGVKPKDIDFSVEAQSFGDMRDAIESRGCKIFLESPQFFTIRAKDKKHGVVDFVLCRKDGQYSDGRRPDNVEVGTLLDDLSRRDFTMNAIAEAEDGSLIDPFKGQESIKARLIECVGDAEERFEEDALRMLRAIRFSITKNMSLGSHIVSCLLNQPLVEKLASVSIERIREELVKAMQHDTLHTLMVLERFSMVRNMCFSSGKLKLLPTLKKELQ